VAVAGPLVELLPLAVDVVVVPAHRQVIGGDADIDYGKFRSKFYESVSADTFSGKFPISYKQIN
jgi:hypothetical protein